jgi:glucose-6-phosphate 1-dehydrogenase
MSKNKLDLDPAILTIFGITGDLARRYLLPAIYQLAHNDLLPTTFKIVGVTRQALTTADIIQSFQKSLETAGIHYVPATLAKLEANLVVVSMDITDNEEYVRLKKELDTIEDSVGQCLHRLFYLSIPSTVYGPVVKRLGQHDLNQGCQHGSTDSRLLIEKPFGYDLNSAEELIKTLASSFSENQIYRIDHYLAKETVQNILTFRASNPLFQAVWSNQHIKRIIITAAESIGIEGRATFYEPIGALRDIVQSHLLQIAALVTMGIPDQLSATAIHTARQKLLESIQPPHPDDMAAKTVRGQYGSYRQEVENPDSQTETFAALELTIATPTWEGVPLILKTGKKLSAKTTEINIVFHEPAGAGHNNYLTMRLQPHEGIALDLRIKRPGFDVEMEHVTMEFDYHGLDAEHPDAYERVLVDTMRGDQTLFATSAEVLASWHVVQPVLDAWQHNHVPLQTYISGSAGPDAAQKLVAE